MEFHGHDINWHDRKHGGAAENRHRGMYAFIGDFSAEVLVDEIFGGAEEGRAPLHDRLLELKHVPGAIVLLAGSSARLVRHDERALRIQDAGGGAVSRGRDEVPGEVEAEEEAPAVFRPGDGLRRHVQIDMREAPVLDFAEVVRIGEADVAEGVELRKADVLLRRVDAAHVDRRHLAGMREEIQPRLLVQDAAEDHVAHELRIFVVDDVERAPVVDDDFQIGADLLHFLDVRADLVMAFLREVSVRDVGEVPAELLADVVGLFELVGRRDEILAEFLSEVEPRKVEASVLDGTEPRQGAQVDGIVVQVGVHGEDGAEEIGGDVLRVDVAQGIVHLLKALQIGEVDCKFHDVIPAELVISCWDALRGRNSSSWSTRRRTRGCR